MTTPAENLRNAQRSRALKTGIILCPNGISTFACVVRDTSATGMQISIDNAGGVPDEFMLLLDEGKRRVPCNVMWRKGAKLGVKFVAALTDRRHHVNPMPNEQTTGPILAEMLRVKAQEIRQALAPKVEIKSRLLRRANAL